MIMHEREQVLDDGTMPEGAIVATTCEKLLVCLRDTLPFTCKDVFELSRGSLYVRERWHRQSKSLYQLRSRFCWHMAEVFILFTRRQTSSWIE